jgi:CRISPR-associated protein Cas2
MLHVVCYDISNDNARTLMSERLLNFGSRIQESVFECLLDDSLYARMLEQIEKIKLEKEDRVRIYRMCARCVEAVKIYGPGEVTKDPDFYLV